LLLDGEDDVGKAGAHPAKDIFQTVKSRTLPRQWNLLNNVFPDILCCRVDFPLSTKRRMIVAFSWVIPVSFTSSLDCSLCTQVTSIPLFGG
jgi:hypothetical protein